MFESLYFLLENLDETQDLLKNLGWDCYEFQKAKDEDTLLVIDQFVMIILIHMISLVSYMFYEIIMFLIVLLFCVIIVNPLIMILIIVHITTVNLIVGEHALMF